VPGLTGGPAQLDRQPLAFVGVDLGPATAVVVLGFAMAAVIVSVGAALVRARRPPPGAGRGEQVAEEVTRWLRLRRFLHRRLDPAQATGLALTIALAVIFLAALVFGLVADTFSARSEPAQVDASAAAWGVRHATPGTVRLFHQITLLGSTMVVFSIVVLIGVFEWARRRRQPWRWSAVAFLATVVVGQNLIANGVKLLVERERPPVPHLTGSSGYSFPSGHSASAAATYAALALLLGAGRRWSVKVWLGTAAAMIAAAVATSRVLLGVHWLSDVIAGVSLGLGWFAVCSIAFGGSLLHFGTPAERAEAAHRRARRPLRLGWRRPVSEGTPAPGPVGLATPELPTDATKGRSAMHDLDPQPTEEQVESRAGSLAAEPGNGAEDTGAQARALLADSEERVDDPAARDPDHPGVIRRTADEGVPVEE
jgi:membrane-associated phospholipid phosphatase